MHRMIGDYYFLVLFARTFAALDIALEELTKECIVKSRDALVLFAYASRLLA